MLEKQKQEWLDMDPKWRVLIVALAIAGSVGIVFLRQHQAALETGAAQPPVGGGPPPGAGASEPPGLRYELSMLPPSNRNQGLEDVLAQLHVLQEELAQYRRNGSAQEPRGTPMAAATAQSMDLNAAILPPVSFAERAPANPASPFGAASVAAPAAAPPLASPAPDAAALPPEPRVWQPVRPAAHAAADARPGVLIPANTGLEAVLLSGVAARPSGATSGAVGSPVSANSVGAPFVSRIKGDAILPNGWKLSDLGDCFLGGSAVAVLSAERAYAIADTLSCVAANGEVYEGPVKAYGLDVDGTLGLAGKVVSKQGAILFQALLTGIASGLGTALTPTPIAGLNTAAVNGSAQGLQYPDGDAIARTAVGAGLGNATAQLSRFYLEFARETFPVIEVVAGTRITWILRESLELKRSRSSP